MWHFLCNIIVEFGGAESRTKLNNYIPASAAGARKNLERWLSKNPWSRCNVDLQFREIPCIVKDRYDDLLKFMYDKGGPHVNPGRFFHSPCSHHHHYRIYRVPCGSCNRRLNRRVYYWLATPIRHHRRHHCSARRCLAAHQCH